MPPNSIPHQRETESRFLGIIALDIRRFSAFTDSERTRLATEFRNAVEAAFLDGGLYAVWRAREFCRNAGDGILIGFDPQYLRDIIDHLPAALQNQLRELYHRTGLNVRMRMGMSLGPIQRHDDERFDVAPNQPLIDACRLCDARPTRQLLEHSDEHATYLAVAVTPTVMTTVIDPDPLWRRPSEFVRVRIDIDEKDYHSDAYVHVPSPSGDLLRFGLVDLPSADDSDRREDEPLDELMKRASIGELPPTIAGANAVRTGDVSGRSTVVGGDFVQHHDHIGRDKYQVNGRNTTINNDDGRKSESL